METAPGNNPEITPAPQPTVAEPVVPSTRPSPSRLKWILASLIILAAVGAGLATSGSLDLAKLLNRPSVTNNGLTVSGDPEATPSAREPVSTSVPAAPACASGTVFDDLAKALEEPGKACELNLVEKGLTTVPDDVAKLTNLTRLSFSKNQITSVPQSILGLSKLVALDFNYNQIIEIPIGIDRLEDLEVLSFGSNKLTSIPTSIGNLKNLLALGLSYNQLTTLPNELALLEKLSILYVRDNNFNEAEKERIKDLLPGVEIIFE